MLRYICHSGVVNYNEPKCISFGGRAADEAVGREMVRILEPLGLEAALRAIEDDAETGSESYGTRWRRQSGPGTPESRLTVPACQVRELMISIETYLLYLAAQGVFFANPPDTSQLLIVANSARHGLMKSS